MEKEETKFNIKELIPYIVILIIIILIRTYIVTPIRVNGISMQETLQGNEYMLLYKFEDIKRYDIVVADLYEGNKKVDSIIKRVFGMPGETIKIEDSMIYINGRKIEDPYGYGSTNDVDEITLGSDEYFLLGDNRGVSLDSRIVGPVKKNHIEGVTHFIIFPFDKFGEVKQASKPTNN